MFHSSQTKKAVLYKRKIKYAMNSDSTLIIFNSSKDITTYLKNTIRNAVSEHDNIFLNVKKRIFVVKKKATTILMIKD